MSADELQAMEARGLPGWCDFYARLPQPGTIFYCRGKSDISNSYAARAL
ncbi:hypothetical protein LNP74_29550 [Klebsiella pneumoniae subsp. pneumoniae]|nr:hypothetical protein [Klebsiella pneumoniae subsp. pneumoniae]